MHVNATPHTRIPPSIHRSEQYGYSPYPYVNASLAEHATRMRQWQEHMNTVICRNPMGVTSAAIEASLGRQPGDTRQQWEEHMNDVIRRNPGNSILSASTVSPGGMPHQWSHLSPAARGYGTPQGRTRSTASMSPPRAYSLGGRRMRDDSHASPRSLPRSSDIQEKSFASSWLRDYSATWETSFAQSLVLKQQPLELSSSVDNLTSNFGSRSLGIVRARSQDGITTHEERHQSVGDARQQSNVRTGYHAHRHHHHENSPLEKDTNHGRHRRRRSTKQNGKRSVFISTPDLQLPHSMLDASMLMTQDSSDDDNHAVTFRGNGPVSLDMLAAGMWHEMGKERPFSAKSGRHAHSRSISPSRALRH